MFLLFRFIDPDGKPTGWHGITYAEKERALFWNIDEFCDPYAAEVSIVDESDVSISFFLEGEDNVAQDGSHLHPGDFLLSAIYDDGREWIRPNWSDNPGKSSELVAAIMGEE